MSKRQRENHKAKRAKWVDAATLDQHFTGQHYGYKYFAITKNSLMTVLAYQPNAGQVDHFDYVKGRGWVYAGGAGLGCSNGACE